MSSRTCPDWPQLMEIAPDLQFKHYTVAEAQLPEALVNLDPATLDEIEICCDLDRHVYYAEHTHPAVVEALRETHWFDLAEWTTARARRGARVSSPGVAGPLPAEPLARRAPERADPGCYPTHGCQRTRVDDVCGRRPATPCGAHGERHVPEAARRVGVGRDHDVDARVDGQPDELAA